MVKSTISGRAAAFVPAVGAWVAIGMGALVLMGWIAGSGVLKSLVPGAAQMKANAAIGLVLAGASLWLRTRPASHESALPRLLAAGVAVLGGATLLEYIAHVDLGIDELLFTDTAHGLNQVPGRMSPFTAWSFVLLGTAIELLRRPASGWIVLVCSGQVLLVGALSVFGYLGGVSEFVVGAWLPPIALNTGLALAALALGLLAAHRRVPDDAAAERPSASERSLHLAFWCMVAVLVLAMGHTYSSNLKFVDAAQSVEAAQEVRIELARLHGCLQQVDSAQRRFARSGDDPSRLDIRSAGVNCRAILHRLEGLLGADPAQASTLQPLSGDIRNRIEALEKLAAADEIAHPPAALRPLLSDEARSRTRADQAAVQAMDAVQSLKLAALRQSRTTGLSAMLVSLMLTLAISIFVFAMLTRNMRLQVRRSNASREQMESQKALLSTVIESSPDVIVYKDRHGRVLGCNRAYAGFVGRRIDEVVGREARDYLPPAEAEKVRLAEAAVLSRLEPSSVDEWVAHPSGARVAMHVVLSPLRDYRGAVTGILAIGRDITDRKEAEEETRRARALAEEAAQTKSAFLANMSHEIRTPLTGVMGMIDMLSAEDLPARQKKYVVSAREAGRHLLQVINDILDFSRIEKGGLQLEAIDFSIPELLEQLRSSIHPSAVERGLDLDIDVEPHPPPVVRGDPTRIKQVLLNLAGNAIKFTHAGHVEISVRSGLPAQGRVQVVFDVRDTGIGIPEGKIGQLFMPFVQADSSIARKYGGSGLGLAISQRLAQAMGGRITVRSTPGAGSVFSFEVPLEMGDPLGVARPSPPLSQAAIPRRILVAEDVEVTRKVLSIALGKQGHRIVFAHNGAEAVAKVQEEAFDLVLMDVQMPVMDGVEATRRIRMLPGPERHIPILGLTANVMAAEQERYLAAGMNECLMKPVDWDQLDAAIGRHGGSGGAAEILAASNGQAPDVVPTLDHDRLASLRALVTPEKFAVIVQGAVDSVSAIIGQMAEGPAMDLLAAQAHKLKGLAGTMGFAMISYTAAAIETAARDGVRAEDLVRQLGTHAAALDRELASAGILVAR